MSAMDIRKNHKTLSILILAMNVCHFWMPASASAETPTETYMSSLTNTITATVPIVSDEETGMDRPVQKRYTALPKKKIEPLPIRDHTNSNTDFFFQIRTIKSSFSGSVTRKTV